METLSKKLIMVASVICALTLCLRCDNPKAKKKNQTKVVAKNISAETKTKEKAVTYRKPIVFIAGFDKGNETFYTAARNYFKEKGLQVIDGQYSLEEIITWLNGNANQNLYSEIHIVNKSNPYKGMNLETVIRGEKITAETLRKTITQGTLPKLKNVVNNNSKIVFHASGLIENTDLIQTLKDAFHTKEMPKVIASPYHTIFGGKFSNHYLAKPFYVFYPTANSPGKMDLSKEIAKKYPEEKEIDWYDALNNEEERYVGEAYTTQFSIPVVWKFDFFNTDNEMPKFTMQEEVMDWIETHSELMAELNKLNISIEKFRWNWSVKNNTLVIRGRTTGLCVLKPLIKPYGDLKHIEPDTSNKRLYAMK
ncbi:hypothetical protein JL193_02735 [Polaribacter batillariae]|uniref:Uncharacterized protein n=1 Tax=Polaribacter batillariae TaxID=2808900 RepID=A0ABX7SVG8_9FLAO|nr:hypothetical protein [Polaribacter batillariae]QTD38240.1 hypothetical protein JL193_02735 [Polaribacter batillariae]